VVSAPPGAGKTTLVSEWHASPAGAAVPLAWLALDPADNDSVRFLAHLLTALESLYPGGTAAASSLLHAPPGQENIESALSALVNDLAARPVHANGRGPQPALPSVVAFDDYHLITAPAVHAAFAFLLEHLPPHLRLLLLTRADPPLPLARLRAAGSVSEIRAADLAFTLDEAGIFFERALGQALDPAGLAALARRTEGWAAGLQLAALALQSPPSSASPNGSSAAFITAFTGSHRYVLDYLVEEVLHRQLPAIQTFLLYTSILPRLTAPLCAALLTSDPSPSDPRPMPDGPLPLTKGQLPLAKNQLPATDCQLLLDTLDRHNLFLIPLDPDRRWYRYHHLFAEALRDQLRRLGVDLERALHRRASLWFEAQDLLEDAIYHALAAADYDRAARLIDPAADRLIRLGEFAAIRAWIEALPPSLVLAAPALCVWYCWTLLADHRLDLLDDYLRAAEAGLDAAEVNPEALALDDPLRNIQRRRRLAGQLAVIRCSRATHHGDALAVSAFARQALAILPPSEPILRAFVGLLLGRQQLSRGEPAAADPVLTAAHEALQPHYHPFIQLQLFESLVELRVLQGRLHAAHALCHQALAHAAEHSLPAFAGFFWLQLAFIAYEWHDFDQADRCLEQGARIAEPRGDQGWLGLSFLLRSRLAQARGDPAQARHSLDEALRCHQRQSGGRPSRYLAAWQGRFWLQFGDLPAARAAFPLRAPESHDGCDALDPANEFENLVLVRLYLAEGRPAEALALSKALRAAATAAGRGGPLLRCLVLQALAHQALGQTSQARRVLDRALPLALPEGYTRLFLDEAAPLLNLLARLSTTHSHRPALDRLIALAASAGALPFLPGALAPGSDLHPAPQPGTPSLRGRASPHTDRSMSEWDDSRSLKGLNAPRALLDPLSPREQEILALLAAGLSNAEIAQRLVVAVSTVRWYTKQIYRKLDVHNRTQAVLRAQSLGLV
jgi:LuxR family maltose regulon positive regulatory protein